MTSLVLYETGFRGVFYALPDRDWPFVLAEDLADFLGVPLKRVTEQLRLAPEVFPEEAYYRLTPQETALIEGRRQVRSGVGASAKYGLLAFTEMGACQLCMQLGSSKAAEVSTAYIRLVSEHLSFEAAIGRARDA